MSKIKFTTTMESELLKKIKIQAIKERLSVSAILERLINEYLSSLPNDD
ncbi:MAG: ribbon-helix-helix protein, CopG family [Clostridium fessum]